MSGRPFERSIPGRAWALSRVSTIKRKDYEIWMHNLLSAGICPLLILTADGPTEMLALEYTALKGLYRNIGYAFGSDLNPKHEGLAE